MSGSALSDQIDDVLALAADILMHPKFDEQELARYKARTLAGLEDQRPIRIFWPPSATARPFTAAIPRPAWA
jgi:hypothetical protein